MLSVIGHVILSVVVFSLGMMEDSAPTESLLTTPRLQSRADADHQDKLSENNR